jgi:hypothetical protein
MAGLAMAKRCKVVSLGTSIPLSVAETSKAAEASGDVVPTPTLFCEKPNFPNPRKRRTSILFFLM